MTTLVTILLIIGGAGLALAGLLAAGWVAALVRLELSIWRQP